MKVTLLMTVLLLLPAGSGDAAEEPFRGETFRDFLTSSTRLRNDVLLSGGFRDNVRVAWGESEYLVVGNGADGVVATRVDADGLVLDDPPFQVDRRGQVRSIAFDGMNWFVVYADDPVEIGHGSLLYGRRLTSMGGALHLMEPFPILIASAMFPGSGWIREASVAFGDGFYLVAWEQASPTGWEVATIRVDADGTVVGEKTLVPSESNQQGLPSTAFDGEHFFVAWTAAGTSIEGGFVDPRTGTTGERIQVSGPRSGPFDPYFRRLYPKVAWNGAHYLIVWSEGSLFRDGPDLVAVRMNAVGDVLVAPGSDGTEIDLATSEKEQWIASVTSDGSEFVISWNEGYGGCVFDPCELPRFAMRLLRLDGAGRPRDARPTEIGSGILVAQTSSHLGRTLFAYQVSEGFRLGFRSLAPRHRPVRR